MGKSKKPEAGFKSDFKQACSVFGCLLIDIPDPVPSANLRIHNWEKKRPFDVVMVTPKKIFCIELKYGYNKQMEHQKETEQKILNINQIGYFVVNKRKSRHGNVYSIIQNESEILKTRDITEIIKYFTDKL